MLSYGCSITSAFPNTFCTSPASLTCQLCSNSINEGSNSSSSGSDSNDKGNHSPSKKFEKCTHCGINICDTCLNQNQEGQTASKPHHQHQHHQQQQQTYGSVSKRNQHPMQGNEQQQQPQQQHTCNHYNTVKKEFKQMYNYSKELVEKLHLLSDAIKVEEATVSELNQIKHQVSTKALELIKQINQEKADLLQQIESVKLKYETTLNDRKEYYALSMQYKDELRKVIRKYKDFKSEEKCSLSDLLKMYYSVKTISKSLGDYDHIKLITEQDPLQVKYDERPTYRNLIGKLLLNNEAALLEADDVNVADQKEAQTAACAEVQLFQQSNKRCTKSDTSVAESRGNAVTTATTTAAAATVKQDTTNGNTKISSNNNNNNNNLDESIANGNIAKLNRTKIQQTVKSSHNDISLQQQKQQPHQQQQQQQSHQQQQKQSQTRQTNPVDNHFIHKPYSNGTSKEKDMCRSFSLNDLLSTTTGNESNNVATNTSKQHVNSIATAAIPPHQGSCQNLSVPDAGAAAAAAEEMSSRKSSHKKHDKSRGSIGRHHAMATVGDMSGGASDERSRELLLSEDSLYRHNRNNRYAAGEKHNSTPNVSEIGRATNPSELQQQQQQHNRHQQQTQPKHHHTAAIQPEVVTSIQQQSSSTQQKSGFYLNGKNETANSSNNNKNNSIELSNSGTVATSTKPLLPKSSSMSKGAEQYHLKESPKQRLEIDILPSHLSCQKNKLLIASSFGKIRVIDLFSYKIQKDELKNLLINGICLSRSDDPDSDVLYAVTNGEMSPHEDALNVSNATIIVSKKELKVLKKEATSVNNDYVFVNPGGICFDAHANLYVCDSGNNRVKVLDAQLVLRHTIESAATPHDHLAQPKSVCVHGDTLFVCDSANHRIVSYRISDGGAAYHFQRLYGLGYGDQPGMLRYPLECCVDNQGVLYVRDHHNSRVQLFGADGGAPIHVIEVNAQRETIYSMTVTENGDIYVAKMLHVQDVDQYGQLVTANKYYIDIY